MRTLSLLTSILIFPILLTLSITGELIHKICNNTRNPSLCLNNLKTLRGESICPNPTATLGNTTMNMAQSRADRTVILTWAHCRAMSVHKPERRMKYYRCFLEYTDVMNQLKQAKKHMVSGAVRYVKKYVLVAVNQVNYCDIELKKPPHDEQSGILEANNKFKDLCSIILAICDKGKK